jgi:hypothetical protein
MNQERNPKPAWLRRLHVTAHQGYPVTNCPLCARELAGRPEQFELNHAAIHEARAGDCRACDKVREYKRERGVPDD